MPAELLKPQASSTPSLVQRVQGRRSIHREMVEVPSPVLKEAPKEVKSRKHKEPSGPLRIPESVRPPPKPIKTGKDSKRDDLLSVIFDNSELVSNAMLYLIVLFILFTTTKNTSTNTTPHVNTLKLKYPNQDPRLWLYFTSGISDIKRFNKPSVIVVMYTDDTEKTAEEIAKNMSKYASSKLANVEDPIILHSDDLNTAEYLEDYGRIITDYKPRIEKRRVMVVKDFDKLNANVARAFHSICDEYTPLVERAFYIFMVKVKSYVGKEVEQIGNILTVYWSELDDDILEPLIARVTNVVLRVAPEF